MYLTTKLELSWDRNNFCCGKESLDKYLKTQAGQDIRRKLSVVFALAEPPVIKGYYTLSNAGVPKSAVPEAIQKSIPGHYEQLPVTLIGRLAIDKKFQGQGLGEALLLDALKRSHHYSENYSGCIAVVVDPLDSEARNFYAQYGFIQLPDSPKMIVPMKTIKPLF
jgi:GNAT superfamily N-acetyltransferase